MIYLLYAVIHNLFFHGLLSRKYIFSIFPLSVSLINGYSSTHWTFYCTARFKLRPVTSYFLFFSDLETDLKQFDNNSENKKVLCLAAVVYVDVFDILFHSWTD